MGLPAAILTFGLLLAGVMNHPPPREGAVAARPCAPSGAKLPDSPSHTMTIPAAGHGADGPSLQITIYEPDDVVASTMASSPGADDDCAPARAGGDPGSSATAPATDTDDEPACAAPVVPSRSDTFRAEVADRPPGESTPAMDTDRRPFLLYLHGGAFLAGDPGDLATFGQNGLVWVSNSSVFRELLNRGWVVGTLDYGLTRTPRSDDPERHVTTADQLRNVKQALAAISARSSGLGIDPTRLVVGGESAGGVLALLTALTPGAFEPDDTVPGQVAGVIALDPPVDLVGLQECVETKESPGPGSHAVPLAPLTFDVTGDAFIELSTRVNGVRPADGTAATPVEVPYSAMLPIAVGCPDGHFDRHASADSAGCPTVSADWIGDDPTGRPRDVPTMTAIESLSPWARLIGLTPDELADVPPMYLACAAHGTNGFLGNLDCDHHAEPFGTYLDETVGRGRIIVDRADGVHWDIGGTLDHARLDRWLSDFED